MRSVVAMAFLCVALSVGRPEQVSAQVDLLGRPAPEIGGGPWLNSQPLTLGALRGRVVLLEFWTGG